MIPAAKLPDVRDDLLRFLATNLLPCVLDSHVGKGGSYDLPAPEAHRPWVEALDGYLQRLRAMAASAALFHVSAEMTAVAAEAGSTMPGYKLHIDDLPAECGLIAFDSPIGVATHDSVAASPRDMAEIVNIAAAEAAGRRLATVEVAAAMWQLAARVDGRPGVLVTLWTNNYDMARNWEAVGDPGKAAGVRRFGWLGYHDEIVLPFGEIVDEETDELGNPKPIRNETLRTLISTWLLMGQPIVTSDPQPLPRQVRRRIERETGRAAPTVRVIKLRHLAAHKAGDEEAEASGRVYRNRWVVRGHWRNQWYPRRKDHRPIYVPSHIKGPKDGPLIGVEKVHDWSR
jgi:hypothetical protein